jgi:hypothetical protein
MRREIWSIFDLNLGGFYTIIQPYFLPFQVGCKAVNVKRENILNGNSTKKFHSQIKPKPVPHKKNLNFKSS